MIKLRAFILVFLLHAVWIQIEPKFFAVAQDDYEVDYEGDYEEPAPTPVPEKNPSKKGKASSSGPETAQGVRAKNRFSVPVQSDTKSVYKKNGVRLDVDTD